jgi:hypothetical protein
VFADLIEETDALPMDLQRGLKKLIDEDKVKNESQKGRRRKNWVKWREKERLCRK